jgi:hypothetical protein
VVVVVESVLMGTPLLPLAVLGLLLLYNNILLMFDVDSALCWPSEVRFDFLPVMRDRQVRSKEKQWEEKEKTN